MQQAALVRALEAGDDRAVASVLLRYAAMGADDLAPLLQEAWERRVPKGWLKN